MTEWIEHNGGPQPVGDDVWVQVWRKYRGFDRAPSMAAGFDWPDRIRRYRILNQHLIDAARMEGIRLGLEAAAKAADALADDLAGQWRGERKSNSHLEGASDGADLAVQAIRDLDPATIAKDQSR